MVYSEPILTLTRCCLMQSKGTEHAQQKFCLCIAQAPLLPHKRVIRNTLPMIAPRALDLFAHPRPPLRQCRPCVAIQGRRLLLVRCSAIEGGSAGEVLRWAMAAFDQEAASAEINLAKAALLVSLEEEAACQEIVARAAELLGGGSSAGVPRSGQLLLCARLPSNAHSAGALIGAL